MLIKNNNFDKLILGTANLENEYGILRDKFKKKEFEKIIKSIPKKKKLTIDTAFSYKKAEKIIGNISIKNKNYFDIITKIPPLKDYKFPEKKILYFVNQSLKNLQMNKLHGILLHAPSDLLTNKGKLIYEQLRLLKAKRITKFIGISAYDKIQINKIIKKFKIDIIQIPYSVFDRRFEKNEWMKRIRKMGIQLHTRSVFFQGILTNPLFHPKKNTYLKKKLSLWRDFCKKKNLNYNEAALNFVLNNKNINKNLIEEKNKNKFSKNFFFKKIKKINYPRSLEITDKNIADLSKIKI